MKKILATILVFGSAATLSACSSDSVGNRDLQPPYAQGRTAGNAPVEEVRSRPAPKRMERVYKKAQTK